MIATYTGDANHTPAESVTKEFTISKASVTIATITVSDKTYDGEAIAITAPAVTGIGLENVTAKLSYKAKDAADDTYATEAPKNAGSYTVKASYAGDDNHKEANVTADFTIEPKALTADMVTLTPESFTYNGHAQKPTVSATDEALGETITVTPTWSQDDTYTNVGTHNVTITASDNYTGSTTKSYAIMQATPTYEIPTGLTATYGETLADVTLPTGWSWQAAETTPVGNIGNNSFHAKFTPTDTENYKVVENVEVTILVVAADPNFTFAEASLTITQGEAVPANALTKPDDCTVTYSSDNEKVATVDAETGAVTVVGVGTATITATATDNYSGTALYTLTVKPYTPPYTPTDPVYYTVTIPTEVTGAIIHDGGTHKVEEYTYCSFRIELDPNGSGKYPTVTTLWGETLTPDSEGNYRLYVTADTEVTIGEVSGYDNYVLSLPTDSVADSDNQYWSGNYIEVIGTTPLRATAEETERRFEVPFGTTVTLRPIETAERKFLQWEDGSTEKVRTLTLRADQEIYALWQHISPVDIETIVANSVIRGERRQLYIEVPNACEVVVYNYNGVPVRTAHLTEGSNRIHSLNAGLYLVKLSDARAVPVIIR